MSHTLVFCGWCGCHHASIECPDPRCIWCGGPHFSAKCQGSNPFAPATSEQAQAVGNFKCPPNPYLNTYNYGWWNQPNFSWEHNNNMENQYFGFQQQPSPPVPQQTFDEKFAKLEDLMSKFIMTTQKSMAMMEATVKENATILNSHSASIRTIQMQLEQINHEVNGGANMWSMKQSETKDKEVIWACEENGLEEAFNAGGSSEEERDVAAQKEEIKETCPAGDTKTKELLEEKSIIRLESTTLVIMTKPVVELEKMLEGYVVKESMNGEPEVKRCIELEAFTPRIMKRSAEELELGVDGFKSIKEKPPDLIPYKKCTPEFMYGSMVLFSDFGLERPVDEQYSEWLSPHKRLKVWPDGMVEIPDINKHFMLKGQQLKAYVNGSWRPPESTIGVNGPT